MEITDKTHMQQFVQSTIADEAMKGGFDFDLYARNQQLTTRLGGGASTLPTAWKTGTTIVGIVYKDGVVLGADTRATGGAEVRISPVSQVNVSQCYYCLLVGNGQELRKDSLLGPEYLVLWCWNCS